MTKEERKRETRRNKEIEYWIRIRAYSESEEVGEFVRILREKMITSNLDIVENIAKRAATKNPEVDYDTVYQAGCIGLMAAVDNYTTNQKGSFKTCAAGKIRQEIEKAILTESRIIYLSKEKVDFVNQMNALIEKLTQELRRKPTCEEIAIEKWAPHIKGKEDWEYDYYGRMRYYASKRYARERLSEFFSIPYQQESLESINLDDLSEENSDYVTLIILEDAFNQITQGRRPTAQWYRYIWNSIRNQESDSDAAYETPTYETIKVPSLRR